MRVSVIVPCYNSSPYLITSVESALAQTHKPLEILCVDDGSANDTWGMIEGLASRYPGIVRGLRHEANKGLPSARNTALRESRGDWFALLDDDDLWLPERLELQARYLEKHPGTEFLHGAAWRENTEEHGRRTLMHEGIAIPGGDYFVPLFFKNFIVVATVAALRCRAEECSFFNPAYRLAEDYDFWLRLALRRCRFGYIEEPIAVYRRHGSNISGDSLPMHRARLTVLENLLASDPEAGRRIGQRGVLVRMLGVRLKLIRLLIEAGEYVEVAREWEKAWGMGHGETAMRLVRLSNAVFGPFVGWGGWAPKSIHAAARFYRAKGRKLTEQSCGTPLSD